jgi:hypothetical protein
LILEHDGARLIHECHDADSPIVLALHAGIAHLPSLEAPELVAELITRALGT